MVTSGTSAMEREWRLRRNYRQKTGKKKSLDLPIYLAIALTLIYYYNLIVFIKNELCAILATCNHNSLFYGRRTQAAWCPMIGRYLLVASVCFL